MSTISTGYTATRLEHENGTLRHANQGQLRRRIPKAVHPAYAHKTGRGVNYRNACIAQKEGATVADCKGISFKVGGKCSAQLYSEEYKPCCADVDYRVLAPVCASRGSGSNAAWYTFRSKAEFNCWDAATKKDKTKPQWQFQYAGKCVCQCNTTSKPVCGSDGLTYVNACHAKCGNGNQFTWKAGACKS